ncbi:MAG TPA: glutamate-5-semialdehyde dehydrogenase, partial [Baekduia sp.]|nr:glutamate-5-semialdehyde dehydrogenase [Baekduia sp.]
MSATTSAVVDTCRAAKAAARHLAALPSAAKDSSLLAIADALEARTEEILAANALDLDSGREAGLTDALLDRLMLDGERIAAIAAQVRDIAALPDPVGEVIDGFRRPNGLDVTKVRTPIGVVAIVYEARPNVTIDAAALCLKSGNACVLRGSSSAEHSNRVLASIAADHAPSGAIQLISGGGREELAELATLDEFVDLIIPRGGEGLKKALTDVATVPMIFAASGNCHIYVDSAADLEMATDIVVNAKCQRPGVCNAAETLLVHKDIAGIWLPQIAVRLEQEGVELRGSARAREVLTDIAEATEEDFAEEFLALVLAVEVVDGVDQAIEHIARYGSGHSEAIVSSSYEQARAFELGVDAACVYVNASTRFTDGGEFGFGAEIGNA